MEETEQYHRHHHHHHHHHRKDWRVAAKRIFTKCLVVFAIFSFVFIIFAVFMPETFYRTEYRIMRLFGVGLVTPDRYTMLDYDGIDVSHHQGVINWRKVAADTCVQFVYVKATEGSTHSDPMYAKNIAGARRAGLKVGSYHYLTSSSTMSEQFDNFKRFAAVDKQDLIPVIDIEAEGVKGWTKKQLHDNVDAFAALIKKHYGKRPALYSNSHFYNNNLAPRFNSYHLFIANYGANSDLVKGTGRHNIWQHSENGVVDGISTDVDLDMFEPGSSLKDFMLK